MVKQASESARQDALSKADSMDAEGINLFVKELGSKDWLVRVKARRNLVEIGGPAVAPLSRALTNRKELIRWEAAKALWQIGDPSATQALVRALEDKMFDVRWLAAEGLISIGKRALVPLLEALVERSDSPWMREGAHHVLHDIDKSGISEMILPILNALEGTEAHLEAPIAAEAALNKLRQSKDKLNH
jgi:HEAT repeat protein